jgi:hypothetical protein
VFIEDSLKNKLKRQTTTFYIDQIQENDKYFISSSINKFKYTLNFNHPIRELIWVFIETNSESNNDWFNYSSRTNTSDNVLMSSAKLILEVDKNDEMNEDYYRINQSYQHHSVIPNKPIYVYSFDEHPEEIQSSGTMNFSKLDNSNLQIKMVSIHSDLYMYLMAININILTIENGMAKIVFFT